MPLPSNAQGTPLNAVLGTPQIDLAKYTVDPTKIQQAMEGGLTLGNQLTDAIILRPRQVDALGATADATQQQQINLQQAAVADRSNIPLRAMNETQVLNNQSINNETAGETARVMLQAAAAKDNQAAFLRAHATNLQTAATDAERVNTEAVGRNELQPTVNEIAAINKKGERERAPISNDSQFLKADSQRAQDTIDNNLANTFEYQDKTFNGALNAKLIAAGQVQSAADVYKHPEAVKALDLGATSAAMGQAYQQTMGFARMLAMGGTGAPLSQKAIDDLYDLAGKKGISPINAAGVPRTPQEMGQLLTQRVNKEDAVEPMKAIRTESDTAQNNLGLYQAVEKLLPGTNTGGLLALPGAAIYNSLAAGWGNLTAESNQQLAVIQNKLALSATGGKLGSGISDGDIKLLKDSFPGLTQSNPLNRSLMAMGLVINNRIGQKNNFYNSVIPTIGITGADKLWHQYLESNPIFDKNPKDKGVLTVASNSMTPQQYLAAIQDPDTVERTLAPTDPRVIKDLPRYDPTDPADTAFVINDKTGKIMGNPAYWTTIRAAHDQVFPPIASAQSSVALQSTMDRIAKQFGSQ